MRNNVAVGAVRVAAARLADILTRNYWPLRQRLAPSKHKYALALPRCLQDGLM